MRGLTHLAGRVLGAAAVVLCLVTTTIAVPPADAPHPTSTKNLDVTTYFDANTLLMFIDNMGSVAYDRTAYLGKNPGLYFPRLTDQTAMYAAGLWVGAKVDGQTRVTLAEYSNEYVPGPMAGGTYQPDGPSYRVYKIAQGDTPLTNPDYADWPFDDGAPAVIDEFGNKSPLLLGKQALWTVFNDADPAVHSNDGGATAPLGIEVQLYAHGDDATCELAQTVFLHYTIINKGSDTLNDTYFSLWADPDLGEPTDDLVGCDTLLSLGYCYNDGPDAKYGPHPPVVGVKLLQGPTVPAPGDSAWVFDQGGWVSGIRNLPMTAFTRYINGTDPHNAQQSYNYMQGLTADGNPMVNPITGFATPYTYPGDPVTHAGWIDPSADDKRLMLSFGPLTMAPGETQKIVIAVLVGAAEAEAIYPTTTIAAAHTVGASDGEANAVIEDPTATTGDNYRVTFQLLGTQDRFAWTLTDLVTGVDVLTGQLNQSGDNNYPVVDGLRVKVIGERPGVGDYAVPSPDRHISWVGGEMGFEGFNGAIGWNSPHHLLWGGPPGVAMGDLKPVLLKFADTDIDGYFSPGDPDASYGYRYGRGFSSPPARPEFAPYIVNPAPFYSFQDFTINVPLSAWDTSVDPPRRLAVGFLENNVPGGDVNGRYYPPDGYVQSNVDADGPREWLFVFDADYSPLLDPSLAVDVVDNPLPILYWLTVARRPGDRFEDSDEFLIIPSEGYNTDADVFEFQAPSSTDVDPDVAVCPPGVASSPVAEIKRVAAEVQDEFYNIALPPAPVAIDILPGECPNWLHPELPEDPRRIVGNLAAGVRGPAPVRVAVLGSATLDVAKLDPMSFEFEGVAPSRYVYSDVAAPVVKETSCDCGIATSDGFEDLVLFYDRDDLFEAITSKGDFDFITVQLHGHLKSGLSVTGTDCLHILKPANSTMAAGAQIAPTRLDGNYPNPFNARTVIRFNLQQPSTAHIEIFDVLGRRVVVLADDDFTVGPHQIEWDGTDGHGHTVASGMYFYRLTAGEFVATKKMLMLK